MKKNGDDIRFTAGMALIGISDLMRKRPLRLSSTRSRTKVASSNLLAIRAIGNIGSSCQAGAMPWQLLKLLKDKRAFLAAPASRRLSRKDFPTRKQAFP